MKRILLFAIAVQLLVGNAFSWGNKGHDVTCAIAARHLSKEAQSAVTSLLDGKSMIYYSAWMDQASNNIQEHLHTKSWHYKNIDANDTFDNAKLNPKGDILTALDEQIAILQDTEASRERKSLALKFLIHLIGDLHQPLHLWRQHLEGHILQERNRPAYCMGFISGRGHTRLESHRMGRGTGYPKYIRYPFHTDRFTPRLGIRKLHYSPTDIQGYTPEQQHILCIRPDMDTGCREAVPARRPAFGKDHKRNLQVIPLSPFHEDG